MPDVNVSRDALGKVKSTLTQFKIDVSQVPLSMLRHIETTEDECEHTIDNLKVKFLNWFTKLKMQNLN